ncbi:MAG: hypothetical protein AAFR17_03670 [Pseudomonadota bacterium]
MAIAGNGNFFAFDGLIAQAGNLADGDLTLSVGLYRFAAFDLAVNSGAGPASVTARIDVVDDALVTVEDLFGEVSSGGFPIGAVVGRSYSSAHTAEGHLRIGAGAQLSFLPQAIYTSGIGSSGAYNTLNAGIGVGGTGQVEVAGSEALLTARGTGALIRIGGAGGDATLNLAQGGRAGTFLLEAGLGTPGTGATTGHVTVDGAGSRLTLGGAYGAHIAPSQQAFSGGAAFGLSSSDPGLVGEGRGYLTVRNGGEVQVLNADSYNAGPRLRFGVHDQSYGSGVVTGAGSLLSITQTGPEVVTNLGPVLTVGEGGEGRLEVRDSATVALVGNHALLAVAQAPSDQSVTEKTSRLAISSGGTVTVDAQQSGTGTILIGNGASAALALEGDNTVLRLTSVLPEEGPAASLLMAIGRSSSGTVTADDGALIELDGSGGGSPNLQLGLEGGTGTLDLDDATLRLSGDGTGPLAPRILIGDGSGSTGAITLRNGARVENLAPAGVTFIAPEAGSTGSIDISGAGSHFDGGTQLLVGADLDETGALVTSGGVGRLTVSAGAGLTADDIIVGAQGRVAFDGVDLDSSLTLHGTLALSPGKITEETLQDEVTLQSGASVEIDVAAFAPGQADLLLLETPSEVDLTDLTIRLAPTEEARFFIGDRFVFAQMATEQDAQTASTTDAASGRAIQLSAEGVSLAITALQGVALSVRADGTLGDVILPAARPFLATPALLIGEGGDRPEETGRDLPVLFAGAAEPEPDPGDFLF